LHLSIFEQPAENDFFSNLLKTYFFLGFLLEFRLGTIPWNS